jgi:chromosome partitioning protein
MAAQVETPLGAQSRHRPGRPLADHQLSAPWGSRSSGFQHIHQTGHWFNDTAWFRQLCVFEFSNLRHVLDLDLLTLVACYTWLELFYGGVMAATRKRLLVSGPKGGIGKTTLARNMAVAAALDGLAVATLDLDLQRSLTKWFGKRPDDLVPITHYEGGMVQQDVEDALAQITDFDLLVIDTPPSIEEHPEAFRLLAMSADLILVPTGQSDDDLDSVCPWMRFVRKTKTAGEAAFVLNRVKPRARSFTEAKAILVKDGRVCPIEVPDYEDIAFTSSRGIGLLELKGGKGTEYVSGVWSFVKSEIGL